MVCCVDRPSIEKMVGEMMYMVAAPKNLEKNPYRYLVGFR
jgi:hypothetical protein